MYGSTVLGETFQQLPFTGFSAAGYVLVAVALLVTGLLLARVRPLRAGADRTSAGPRRTAGIVAAVAVAVAGVLLLVFSGWWRGFETWSAAHAINVAGSRETIGVPQNGIVVVTAHTGPPTLFALTSECTVAQILGAFLIGGAPLFLVRRLSALRVSTALLLASLVLVVVNLLRLTAIGVAIEDWGQDGFALAHTYFGSLLTFVGTCLAGIAFAVVLIAHRAPRELEP